jgi:hypothetical protein
VTDYPHNSDDPISNPLDPNCDDNIDDDEFVEAIFVGGPRGTAAGAPGQLDDLSWLFLCWAWESGYRDWTQGVRALARALRGLERTGLIERRSIRSPGRPTHHGFILTNEGRAAVKALSGAWLRTSES